MSTINTVKKIVICLAITWSCFSQAQSNAPKKVAIFVYTGAEILDFTGPAEVFSAAGFDTFIMSLDGKEILSQRFITVKPQYSLENAPVPDIVVFPGGGAHAAATNDRIISWVKKLKDQGSIIMSVCTGAEILARAGFLENKNVTTWHGFTEKLQAIVPSSKVLENTRFVDNGNIITTAGVSAGIDGALHLVARIKGIDAAKETAHYMEYDKWDPEAGRVDVKQ